MKERIPGLVTTDVRAVEGVACVLPGDLRLPFPDGSLRAIVMTDVLHHLQDPRGFFREATRTVRPGGAIVMIEPWVTRWSSFVYRRLHAEPFRPESEDWELPPGGPCPGPTGRCRGSCFSVIAAGSSGSTLVGHCGGEAVDAVRLHPLGRGVAGQRPDPRPGETPSRATRA